jgi:hypothetical protein
MEWSIGRGERRGVYRPERRGVYRPEYGRWAPRVLRGLMRDGVVNEWIRYGVAAALREIEVAPCVAAAIRADCSHGVRAPDLPYSVRDRLVSALPLAPVPRSPLPLAKAKPNKPDDNENGSTDDAGDDGDFMIGFRRCKGCSGGRWRCHGCEVTGSRSG